MLGDQKRGEYRGLKGGTRQLSSTRKLMSWLEAKSKCKDHRDGNGRKSNQKENNCSNKE